MRALLWTFLLAGCQGAAVESPTADASELDSASLDSSSLDSATTEASSLDSSAPEASGLDSATDAAACTVPGNLVINPSFEIATETAVASWSAELIPKTGDAYDCVRYAEWRSKVDYELIDQTFALPAEAPIGATFEFAAMARSLDGNTAPLGLYFEGGKDDYDQKPSVAVTATWTRVSALFTLKKPTTTITIALRPVGPGLRALALDLVTVVRKS